MIYKDPEQVFRKAVYTALANNITYNGTIVPVYDEFASDTAPNIFIVLGNQYADDRRNYAKFVTGSVMVIDICHHQNRGMTKQVVDTVANSIKAILMPNIATFGITLDAGWSVNGLYRETSSYLSEQNNTKWVIRKVERYRCEIQQDI
jgi:hypothetical protein